MPLARELLALQPDDEAETTNPQYEIRQDIASDWLTSYETRMRFETPLVVKGRLSTFVRDLINESQDAFRFGLPLVTIAGCRMAIDGLLAEIAKVQFPKLSQTTRRRIQGRQKGPYPIASELAAEKTSVLIDELPERYLNP